jgi:hypothetical protein
MFTHWDETGSACERSSDPRAAAAAAALRTLRYRVLFRTALQRQTLSSSLCGDALVSHETVVALVASLCGTPQHAAVVIQQLDCYHPPLSESDFVALATGKFPALGMSSFGYIKHLTRPQPRAIALSRSADQAGACGSAHSSFLSTSSSHAGHKWLFSAEAAASGAEKRSEEAVCVRSGTIVGGQLRETVDWRGVLVNREARAFADANQIIARTKAMTMNSYCEDDATSDGDWPHTLGQMTGHKSAKSCARVMKRLSAEVRRIVQLQPMVVRTSPPTKVFGDIHGQLRDLLLLFREHGFPSNRGGDIETTSYVFNGDFVDRGSHQVEVVCLLFALKVAFPSKVFLIRGNHEFPEQNEHTGACGFKAACDGMFDDDGDGAGSDDVAEEDCVGGLSTTNVYSSVHACFEWLPFACVIADRCVAAVGV